jgi:hypothetical protein
MPLAAPQSHQTAEENTIMDQIDFYFFRTQTMLERKIEQVLEFVIGLFFMALFGSALYLFWQCTFGKIYLSISAACIPFLALVFYLDLRKKPSH